MLSLMEEGKYTQLKFDILINQEIIHNIKQVAKILKYYGYNDIDEFIFPEKLTNRYRENTSILSYFIIKLFILADYKNNMNKSFNSIFYEPKILELFNNNTLKDQINNQMSKCGRIYNTSLKMTLN